MCIWVCGCLAPAFYSTLFDNMQVTRILSVNSLFATHWTKVHKTFASFLVLSLSRSDIINTALKPTDMIHEYQFTPQTIQTIIALAFGRFNLNVLGGWLEREQKELSQPWTIRVSAFGHKLVPPLYSINVWVFSQKNIINF